MLIAEGLDVGDGQGQDDDDSQGGQQGGDYGEGDQEDGARRIMRIGWYSEVLLALRV